MQIKVKDRGFAVTVLNGQISAATTLTSISLTLCALIGVLLGKSTENLLTSSFIFGNKSKSTNSIKYVAILSFFIMAFACFVQTTRHFAHASFLICAPTDNWQGYLGSCWVHPKGRAQKGSSWVHPNGSVKRKQFLGSRIASTLLCNQFTFMDFLSDSYVCWFTSYSDHFI